MAKHNGWRIHNEKKIVQLSKINHFDKEQDSEEEERKKKQQQQQSNKLSSGKSLWCV